MTQPIDGDALLAKLKPTLKIVRQQVCMRPDLMDEWEAAESALIAAQDSLAAPGRRLAAQAESTEALAERVQAAEAAAEEASVWFEFQALPVEKYQMLVAEHPPRGDNHLDLFAGHDREAVADELVRRCLINPVFSEAGWAEYKATCRASVWGALRDAASEANGGQVAPPKSLVASPAPSKSGSASE